MLATNHQEHANRAAQAEHVLNTGRKHRKRRAPSIVPHASLRFHDTRPSLTPSIWAQSCGLIAASRGELGVVRSGDAAPRDPGLGDDACALGLVGHDVEANDGPQAMGDYGYLPAP